MLLQQTDGISEVPKGTSSKGTPPAGPHIECQLGGFDPESGRR